MFESDFLDFFSRTPWWTVPLIWGPVALGCVATGVARAGLGALAVALLFVGVWTLAEYGLHRTLFHWVPNTGWGPRMHFILHGVHHDSPDDPYRLVMPPAAALVLAVLFWGLFRLLLGPTWVFPAFGGFVAGYIVYDCTHYAIHHFRPRTRYGRRLRAHHMNHHHNHPDRKFGVSNLWWDRVFGTM